MGYLNEGARQVRIIEYDAAYRQQIIDLILQIQNDEFQVGLFLAEQPDLLDVPSYYEKDGGAFLLALAGGQVVGTLAFMNYGAGNAVLKKLFVRADHRGTGVGFALYQELIQRMDEGEYKRVLLDTPAVATKSHRFYERQGFKRIPKEAIPFDYVYPDRNSYLSCSNCMAVQCVNEYVVCRMARWIEHRIIKYPAVQLANNRPSIVWRKSIVARE